MTREGKIWLKSLATVAAIVALAALAALYESPRERQVKQRLARQQQQAQLGAEQAQTTAPRYANLIDYWRNMGVGSLILNPWTGGTYRLTRGSFIWFTSATTPARVVARNLRTSQSYPKSALWRKKFSHGKK